jgi:ribosomal protein S27E
VAGMPRSVSTAANRGTYICLVCEKCAQEWRVFRRADTPVVSIP